MPLALIDLLMLPNEAGWHELVDRNGGEPYTSARYRPWSTAWSKLQARQALSSDARRSPAIT